MLTLTSADGSTSLVSHGTVELPRTGIWIADVHMISQDIPDVGDTVVATLGAVPMLGSVAVAQLVNGIIDLRVVGGAGGLGNAARPKHYHRPLAVHVLTDLIRDAGEVLSNDCTPEIIATPLEAWTTFGLPTGTVLASLCTMLTPSSKKSASPNSGTAGGNIDLNNRPIIHNPDGSISTVFSMTFGPEADGTWLLLPGVRLGLKRKMTPREAYAWYRKTGQYLGKFPTMAAADAYAESLHEDQASQYLGTTAQPPPVEVNWRILSDGTTWIGTETWPDCPSDFRSITTDGANAAQVVGTDGPAVWPGTLLGGRKVDFVTHDLDHNRTRILFAEVA